MRTLFANRSVYDYLADATKSQNSQDILGLQPERSRGNGSRHPKSLATLGSWSKADAIGSMGVVHHQSWVAPPL